VLWWLLSGNLLFCYTNLVTYILAVSAWWCQCHGETRCSHNILKTS